MLLPALLDGYTFGTLLLMCTSLALVCDVRGKSAEPKMQVQAGDYDGQDDSSTCT